MAEAHLITVHITRDVDRLLRFHPYTDRQLFERAAGKSVRVYPTPYEGTRICGSTCVWRIYEFDMHLIDNRRYPPSYVMALCDHFLDVN